MALKTPPNHRNSHFVPPGPVSGLGQNIPLEPFARNTAGNTEGGGRSLMPDDHPLLPRVSPEMLLGNDYRVALVSRNEWAQPRESAEPPPAAASALVLPFSWKELIAEVTEFVRGTNHSAERRVARFADVCVDFIRMEVSRLSGEIIALTKQELKTLQCFLTNPERVFSRDELLKEAWGYANYPSTRTVDNHVLRLRQKLERDPARPVHFLTVHGIGYKFVPQGKSG